ncbi:MAG: 30S ribosomal protein S12 methylthiotransferase RimO [Candidatus Amulumruptor caecigallinarius]|uniref:Ribosomal protein uS12 methylthiotransferase RimO n=1 Tax=Candidatus Amulumruptor caecigallinarius TaxID=2109911 RepID=A0A4Q0U7Y8_9BACT|nr:MAG: 30S ribosomal protein S12 methylthiotransferase RimO [Candidatus Amulumruptor caecigallinarius]HJE39660.1 30S ribosomal protein S12 methylthiotransferase RimO [Candidatus Amulumruptor caecigallinarius]
MKHRTVDIISLGCSKNLVDSERLMKMLRDAGCEVRFDHDTPDGKSDIAVINTCGFIGDAKEESIDTIMTWVGAKDRGMVQRIYVMGCLSERYKQELPPELPEVDGWYGKFDWPGIVSAISKAAPEAASYDRIITTPSHHAYLKIAEGCNRFCAFCAIPLITGRYKSRSMEEIVEEAAILAGRGVSEFNVIAQDLSAYGTDIYGRQALAELTERLAQLDGVRRIRLHYAYPSDFPMDVLDVMARYPNVCNYIDIALQHIANPVLKNMRRHIDAKATRELLAEMRRRVPGLHIRTTLMVGFPGEGDAEFDELMDFVREQRFERMGAFAYCEEDDTYAAKTYADSIPDDVKQSRLDRLMALQESISLEIQQAKEGSTLEVVIDSYDEDYFIGRTEWDSPEVDPVVLIPRTEGASLRPGQYVHVTIDEALPFELIGQIANSPENHTANIQK